MTAAVAAGASDVRGAPPSACDRRANATDWSVQAPRALVGRRVRKSFGARVFWGSVVGRYAVGGGVFYKISFDDGDVDVLPVDEALEDVEQARRHAREDAGDREVSPYQAELRRPSIKRKRDDGEVRVRVWGQRLYASIYTSVERRTYIKEFLKTEEGGEGELEASGVVNVGDCIVAVNNEPTEGLKSHQISELIRSKSRPMWLTLVRGDGVLLDEEGAKTLAPGTKRRSDPKTTTSQPHAASELATSAFARVEAAAGVTLNPATAPLEPPVVAPQPVSSVSDPQPTIAAPEPAEVNARSDTAANSSPIVPPRAKADPPAPTTSAPNATGDPPTPATSAPSAKTDLPAPTVTAPRDLRLEEKIAAASSNDKMTQLRDALVQRQSEIRQRQERMQQQLREMGSNMPTRGANNLPQPSAYQASPFPPIHVPARFVQQRVDGTIPHGMAAPVPTTMPNSMVAQPMYAVVPSGNRLPMLHANAEAWRAQQARATNPAAARFVSYPQQHLHHQQQQQYEAIPPQSAAPYFKHRTARQFGLQRGRVYEATHSHIRGLSAGERRFDDRRSQQLNTPPPGQSAASSSVEDVAEAEAEGESDLDADAAAIAALGDTTSSSPSKDDSASSSFLSPGAGATSDSEMTSFISPSISDTVTPASTNTRQVVMSDTAVMVTIHKPRLLVTLGTMGSRVGVTSFVQDHDGNRGEIEESGKVIVGDIIVAVNNMRVKPHTPPSVLAHIVNTSPRPLVLAFERAEWDTLMNQY